LSSVNLARRSCRWARGSLTGSGAAARATRLSKVAAVRGWRFARAIKVNGKVALCGGDTRLTCTATLPPRAACSLNLNPARCIEIKYPVPTYKVDGWARICWSLHADTALDQTRPMSQSKTVADDARVLRLRAVSQHRRVSAEAHSEALAARGGIFTGAPRQGAIAGCIGTYTPSYTRSVTDVSPWS
jgi:hypothetical protein